MCKVNSSRVLGMVFFTPNDSSPFPNPEYSGGIHCAVVAKIHFIMNYMDYFTLFV